MVDTQARAGDQADRTRDRGDHRGGLLASPVRDPLRHGELGAMTMTGQTLVDGLYREGPSIRDTKAPNGPLDGRWSERKFGAHLVSPTNRRKLTVIIIGTGPVSYTHLRAHET